MSAEMHPTQATAAPGNQRIVRVTRTQVAAAQLHETLDARLGQKTPDWVRRLARLRDKAS